MLLGLHTPEKIIAYSMGCDIVTGGAGFVGSHLVDRLIADGRRVRVLEPADITNIQSELGWQPKVGFAEGVRIMRVEYWRDAPVWTVSSIAEATADWHKFLGHVEPRSEG